MEVDQFLSGLISPSFGNIGNIGPVGADTIAEDEEIEKIEQLYSLGNLSVVEGSYSSAVKYFTEALEIDHSSKKVLIGRATAYLREGDLEKVINDAKNLMQALPEDVDAQSQGRFLLACAYESQGDYQQSLENLLKLHLQNPQYPEVESQIMRIALKILKSSEDFEYESFPALLQILADKMFKKSLLSPAQSIIEFIIHQEVNVPNEVLIKSLLTGARILMAMDDKERAILTYQECILRSWKLNLSVTESEARKELAELYFNWGDFFQAAFAFEKYLCLLDFVKSSSIDNSKSSDKFWNTENIVKRTLEAHLRIAESFLKIGEIELAQKHAKSFSLELEAALASNVNVGERFKSLILKLDSEVNKSCGLYTEALKNALDYLEVLRKTKEDLFDALFAVGLLYMKTKFYQSAEETFSECSKLCLEASKSSNLKQPHLMNLCLSLYNLGKSFFKQEKFEKAKDSFNDCLKQCKSVGKDRSLECKCLMKLADCCLKNGKSSQAVYHLECALELQKDLPEVLYQVCLAKSASVMQHSATQSELLRAIKILEDLVGKFWDKALDSFVKSNRFEGKDFDMLNDISNARIHILVKLGFTERALLACETFRSFKFDAMSRQKSELLPNCHKNFIEKLEKEVTLDSMQSALSVHGTPAIYLHLTDSYLFIWVLHPNKGLLLFHKHTVESSQRTLFEILSDYRDMFASRNSGLYHFENRMISDCKQPFKLLPKRESESNAKEAKLLSDFCHFVFEPLKSELSKLKAEKIALVADGLLSVVPLSDMFQSFWCRKISYECPVFEIISSVTMLHWILEFTGISDATQEKPISSEAGLNVTIPPPSSLETSFPKRNIEQPSPAKTGTANIMGWASLTEGTGVGPGSQGTALKEVPLLQYKRQIQSAGGDQNDIANMYRGNYAAAERYNDAMTAAAAQILDNESLRTDASSLRRHPYSTSSLKASANEKSPMSKLSKQNKATEKSSASPNLSQQRPSLASDQLTESGSVTIDKSQAEKNMEKIEGSFSTLVTETWKGKTIKDSKIALENYSPIGSNKIFRFLGAPVMPEKVNLDKFTWKPSKVLKLAQEELNDFANFFKTTAIIGELCTKSEALKLMQRSFCIHLATYINFESCAIAFTPEAPYQKMNCIKADAAVANLRDLLDLDLSSVELLVLSSFPSQKHANPEAFTNLLVLLISLGVKCIVYSIQAVPLNAVKKFFGYFYRAVRKIEPACSISAALKYAKEHMLKDPKFSAPENWQCFQMFGVDVQIKGNEIIHDMLDDIVDHVETAQEHDYFNIPEPIKALDKKTDILFSLRDLVADILTSHMKELDIVQSIHMLLSQAIAQLHASPSSGSNMYRLRDPRVIKSQVILSFLHFLRFDFQPYGCSDLIEDFDHPVVVWPHWNKDELLHPSLEVLKNISLVQDNITLLEELVNVLKFSEGKGKEENENGDLVSLLIDVLSLSEHAPEVQMYMTDAGVKKVWQCAPSRRLMTALGFHQVGLSLSPYRNLANTRYQQCVLRILCALSGVKGEAMVGKVDANYLAEQKQSLKSGDDSGSFSGEANAILTGPTSNLRIPVQWRVDTSGLSPNEVKSLAHAINSIKVEYKQNMSSIMAKHRAYLAEHAETWIDETWGVTPVRSDKIKVAPGGTPSSTLRVQLHPPPHNIPTIEDTDVQREYSHYLMEWRAADIAIYRHHDIRALLFNRLAVKPDTV